MSSQLEPFVLQHLKAFNSQTSAKLNFADRKKSSASSKLDDRVSIFIPYSNRNLYWEVLFNSKFASHPPDFLFHSSQNGQSAPVSEANSACLFPYNHHDVYFIEDMNSLQTLKNWNYQDPLCFANLMNELLTAFKTYHKQVVASHKNERIQFEYQTTAEMKGVEFYVYEMANTQLQEIHFIIPLNNLVDDLQTLTDSKMEAMKQQQSAAGAKPVDSATRLLVVYNIDTQSGQTVYTQTQLMIPDILQAELGKVKIPDWNQGSCLVEYLPQVQEAVQKCIKMVVYDKLARKQFIQCLAQLLGQPLEFDSETFFKAVFLMSVDEFVYLVFVTLPEQFPEACPLIQLQSAQHVKKGTQSSIIRVRIQNMPYSGSIPVPKIAESIKEYLQRVQADFKNMVETQK